jgi:hypothetical protein
MMTDTEAGADLFYQACKEFDAEACAFESALLNHHADLAAKHNKAKKALSALKRHYARMAQPDARSLSDRMTQMRRLSVAFQAYKETAAKPADETVEEETNQQDIALLVSLELLRQWQQRLSALINEGQYDRIRSTNRHADKIIKQLVATYGNTPIVEQAISAYKTVLYDGIMLKRAQAELERVIAELRHAEQVKEEQAIAAALKPALTPGWGAYTIAVVASIVGCLVAVYPTMFAYTLWSEILFGVAAFPWLMWYLPLMTSKVINPSAELADHFQPSEEIKNEALELAASFMIGYLLICIPYLWHAIADGEYWVVGIWFGWQSCVGNTMRVLFINRWTLMALKTKFS